jgi:hypothetical protein
MPVTMATNPAKCKVFSELQVVVGLGGHRFSYLYTPGVYTLSASGLGAVLLTNRKALNPNPLTYARDTCVAAVFFSFSPFFSPNF